MSTVNPGSDDELLAAELAVGLLEGDERQVAHARLATDRRFAAMFQRWQNYVAILMQGPDEAPDTTIWSRIAARLRVNEDRAASSRNHPERVWQWATLAASLAALILGVVAIERPYPAPPHPVPVVRTVAPLVAVLSGERGSELVAISFDRATGRLTSIASGLSLGDHAAQLWVIPADKKPRSLGLVAQNRPEWRGAPADVAHELVPGAALAVSLEPPGGSPKDQPTGAIILKGKLNAT